MATPNDTSPDAERVLIECLRRMPIARKFLLLGDLWDTAKTLHAAGYRMRNPTATAEEIREDWMLETLGPELVQEIKEARGG